MSYFDLGKSRIITSVGEFESSDNLELNIAGQVKFDSNVTRHLTMNDKGKFRWNNTFENLEIMMNNILEKQISWTSSGEDCKKLEVDDLCVR